MCNQEEVLLHQRQVADVRVGQSRGNVEELDRADGLVVIDLQLLHKLAHAKVPNL